MRALGQPEVLRAAAFAALGSAVLSAPRLLQWPEAPYPIWFYEALLFLGGMVLWAFVFAWSSRFTQRPVFTLHVAQKDFVTALVAGIAGALLQYYLSDPILRARIPHDFPANTKQWLGMTLFGLAFTSLFLVFAPFAWLARLSGNRTIAAALTIAFGLFVVWFKNQRSPTPLEGSALAGLLATRFVGGAFSILFFIRGGVVLAWFFHLLIQSRLLFE
ncbi:MAG TPA: hypothetical protein VLT36_22715 [Candidatus Dormibacteraeota bacterium]|nr:hypothetical protein [Candidatus Dormibacteraeota bacterium]